MNSGGAGSLEVCNSKIILNFNFRISECFCVLYCLFAGEPKWKSDDNQDKFKHVWNMMKFCLATVQISQHGAISLQYKYLCCYFKFSWEV